MDRSPANRSATGRFLPGQSGNPLGRPKGLAALVQAETRDGAELVAFMVRVLRDAKQATVLRMQAAQWLADRGFGRAVVQLEGTLETTVDATVTHVDPVWAHLSEDDLDRFTRAVLGPLASGAGAERDP